MSAPETKKARPPPLKLSQPLNYPLYSFKESHTVLSPGSYIEPYVLTEKQRVVLNEIQTLRKHIQSTMHHDSNDRARVLEGTNIYLTNAFVAECNYAANSSTSLVSCLPETENDIKENRPNSIYIYRVRDCGDIKILRKLDDIVKWIDNQIQHGNTVILHCYAGINRSASVALAYHCLKTGHDIVTGFKYLAQQRPGILTNTDFIEQLIIWADSHDLLPKSAPE